MSSMKKRIFDLIGAVIGLILSGPIILVIAILIKFTSKGPILFKQTRIGKNGKPFTYYKFRTMYTDFSKERQNEYVQKLIGGELGEKVGNIIYKLSKDPRITPIGRFLRKTSLDELPQLFNVLKGDMSLVGPRPALPYELEFYNDWHKERLKVKPGITGLWQVSGKSMTTFNEMIKLDIMYIKNQSLFFDIKIIIKSIFFIFINKGAM